MDAGAKAQTGVAALRPATQTDDRLAQMLRFASRAFFREIQEFTAWRNRFLRHGVMRHASADSADFETCPPRAPPPLSATAVSR